METILDYFGNRVLQYIFQCISFLYYDYLRVNVKPTLCLKTRVKASSRSGLPCCYVSWTAVLEEVSHGWLA